MSIVGTVSELRRYPVKSMLGEALDVAPIQARGVAGDRAYALIDVETGKVVSAKVLSGPGHGLNEAAQEAFSRFRFKPPTKGGRPVSTEIKYRYTFVLN